MSAEIPNPVLIPVTPKLGIRDWFELRSALSLGSGRENKNPPLSKRLTLALELTGLSVLAVACGGAAIEPPTTAIESTTTTPTILPSTSITEATITTTSTTGAETTIPSIECPEPTGQIIDSEGNPVPLGLISLENRIYDDGSTAIEALIT